MILKHLEILDTPAEQRFDRITQLASAYFNVPIALVSLLDANRQWFKSCIGLDVSETPRGISFCGHAILQDDVFIIEDSSKDERFFKKTLKSSISELALVTGWHIYIDENDLLNCNKKKTKSNNKSPIDGKA